MQLKIGQYKLNDKKVITVKHYNRTVERKQEQEQHNVFQRRGEKVKQTNRKMHVGHTSRIQRANAASIYHENRFCRHLFVVPADGNERQCHDLHDHVRRPLERPWHMLQE